jgi:hypothetical protein
MFVARRTNAVYGLMAMLLPSLTVAYYYASEARGYAFVLAFGAIALVCWQLAAEGVRRRIALVGLAVALALATSSHYYAILLLVPLALGELTRTLAGRRVDPAVWVAFCFALLPFAAFIQLVRASHGYAAGFWGRPTWPDSARFFSFLFDTRWTVRGIQLGQVGRPTEWWLVLVALGVLALALVVLSPGSRWLRNKPWTRAALLGGIAGLSLVGVALVEVASRAPVSVSGVALVGMAMLALAGYVVLRTASSTPLLAGPPAHEVVAAGAFLLVPLAGVVVGKTVTNAYSDRYALSAVIGLAVLPFALYRLEGRRTAVGSSVVAALAVAFGVVFVAHERSVARVSADQERTLHFLEQKAGTRAPILIDNDHLYLELSYAAPPSLAKRFFYVADPQRDSTQRGLLTLGRIAPLRVYGRADAAVLAKSALAFSSRREADWADTRYWTIMRVLKAEGRTITRQAVYGDWALYEISASR